MQLQIRKLTTRIFFIALLELSRVLSIAQAGQPTGSPSSTGQPSTACQLAADAAAKSKSADPAGSPGNSGVQLVKGLDTHSFKITTVSEEAQAWFNQGVVLIYGFNHAEAIRSFRKVIELDPDAAMPWWGIAYCNGMHLNAVTVTEAQWKAGREAIDQAIAELDNETEVEKALVHAMTARTAWPAPAEQRPYDEAFAREMKTVYEKFGADPNIAVIYAESLMNLQPWDYWNADLTPKGNNEEFMAVIERALATNPNHPNAAHLYIHAVEAGPNPAKAEAAADMLLTSVPAAGHLVHMPSHLFARIGRYADAVKSNELAVVADDEFFKLGNDPEMYYVYHAHNLHFLAFAAMMEGQYQLAIDAARRLERCMPDAALDQFAFLIEGIMPTSYHVMIRFGKWEDILKEPAPSEKRTLILANYHYARGIAHAALGKTAEAREDLARFNAQIEKVPQEWLVFANKAHDVLPIGRLMLEGEIAYREGRFDETWKLLSDAIKAEDALIYDEPPGWMIPVRHSMGALLMEQGEFEKAEKLYREDQLKHAKNGWSLLGLQQSLVAQKRYTEARMLTQTLNKAWERLAARPTSSCLCAPRNIANSSE